MSTTTSTTSSERNHQAPDPLGVLSHYDAVIWYTGDDYLSRLPNQVPGTGTARYAVENMIAVRDFINEGGKLFYTGQNAGQQYAEGNEFRNFGFPEPTGAPGSALGRTCTSRSSATRTASTPIRRRPASRAGRSSTGTIPTRLRRLHRAQR